MPAAERLLLVGCGILREKIRWLIDRNAWPLDTVFLDSALHCELDRLAEALTGTLERHRGRWVIVFYGACHPLMDRMLEAGGTFRTEGQNCVAMLLGHERFMAELEQGAFFLLREWALRWESILTKSFGTKNLAVIRDIFHGDRASLLALHTPCSGDFAREAQAAADLVDLPLRRERVTLDHHEAVLRAAIVRSGEESPCRR